MRLYPTRQYARLTPGESLRLAREYAELTQAGLADLSDVPQSAISAIEHGRMTMGAERAARFARALRVHPAVLIYPDWTDGAFAAER